jgi:hypothetical protein
MMKKRIRKTRKENTKMMVMKKYRKIMRMAMKIKKKRERKGKNGVEVSKRFKRVEKGSCSCSRGLSDYL